MTTQLSSPAGPADGTGTEPAQARYEAGTGGDRDVIVLDEHDIVDENDLAGESGDTGALAGDVASPQGLATPRHAADSLADDPARTDPAAAEEPATSATDGPADAPTALSADWHDIQAMFVDDPQGSVAKAAEAAQSAAAALVDTLQQRQAALAPDVGGADTEQLRAALRSYRTFCQSMADIGERITAA